MNFILQRLSTKLYKKYDYNNSQSTEARFNSVPLFLNSWQAVCLASEIKFGKVLSKNIMGVDIVVWKDNTGKVSVLDAHCTHLGIHLGSGGKVQHGKLVCPFHHRAFDSNGVCTQKNKKNIFSYPIDVNNEIVFAWFDKSKSTPAWFLPRIAKDLNGEKWKVQHSKLKGIEVKSHPITYIENGVDFNHAVKLHGYKQSGTSMSADGPELAVHFKHTNISRGFINIKSYGPFVIDYHVTFTWWKKTTYRFLVLLQTTSESNFIAHKIKMTRTEPEHSVLTRLLYKGIFIYFELKLLKNFMLEDHMIMINRKHLDKPDYDLEDTYIPEFRKWYEQFY